MLASHQTVRLSRGMHRSAQEGACVMELASMLAGEPFSDRPRSVCPVIGAFLRIYNDRLDDDRRQDLYPYAAKVVGSAASEDVLRARSQACEQFAETMVARRSRLLLWVHRRQLSLGGTPSAAGVAAARAILHITEETHSAALAHVDLMLSIGAESCSLPAGHLASPPCETDSYRERVIAAPK